MEFTTSRRRFLGAASASATLGLAGCAGAEAPQDPTAETTASGTDATETGRSLPDAVGLETLATGFEVPLDVAFAPDADRRYVADQRGRVFVHESGGLRDEPFLDLRDAIVTGYETGLLGVALHPDFAENRRVFVRYSAPPREGTPDGYSHTFVLAEFEATDDGTRAVRESERTLLELPEPQGNHNAGPIVFGPDGYLYVAVGDGGGGGDRGTGHAEDWYDANEGGNGQDVTENLLGSVLRIDVDNSGDDRNYAIPDDNPLVGRAGRDEHYAWGFRNPWGMAFDRSDLLVADVGQNAYEEVNLVERGGNYGWNVKEGTHCFGADDCPEATPESVRGGEPLLDPVVEYSQSGGDLSGSSVIGGQMYRGSALPGLEGRYVFADLAADGRLFVATPPESREEGAGDGASASDGEDDLWPTAVLDVADADAGKLGQVYAFGRDADGEVYVLASGSEGGGIHRVVPTE